MQRRTLLKLGVVASAVLAAAGGAASLLQPGLKDGRLTETGRTVFRAVSRGVLEGTLPAEGSLRTKALDELLVRVEELTSALPPHAQDELAQLLSVLASAPGRRVMVGLEESWNFATDEQVRNALQSMRVSRLALRQQAYAALHDITAAAYFTEVSTWAQLGYPGPMKI